MINYANYTTSAFSAQLSAINAIIYQFMQILLLLLSLAQFFALIIKNMQKFASKFAILHYVARFMQDLCKCDAIFVQTMLVLHMP